MVGDVRHSTLELRQYYSISMTIIAITVMGTQRFRIQGRYALRRVRRDGFSSHAEARRAQRAFVGKAKPPRSMDRVLDPGVLPEVAGQPHGGHSVRHSSSYSLLRYTVSGS